MEYEELDDEYDEMEAVCGCEVCELSRKNYSRMNRKERRRLCRDMARTQKTAYLFHIGFSIEEIDGNTE